MVCLGLFTGSTLVLFGIRLGWSFWFGLRGCFFSGRGLMRLVVDSVDWYFFTFVVLLLFWLLVLIWCYWFVRFGDLFCHFCDSGLFV